MKRLNPLAAAVLAVSLALGGAAGCASDGAQRSTGQVLDDAAITAKVKAELVKEPGVSALAINVDTARGVVSLNGRVSSHDEANRAVSVARGVAGVRSVINNLEVRSS